MSDKLSTKNVKTEGKGSKTLEPGNVLCTITGVALKPFTFKPGGYEIILSLETKPVGEGFEGFFVDPQDQSKGRHLGQVGKVKLNQWAYADGATKTGVAISRNVTMMQDLKRLCVALGPNAAKWFDDQDDKHASIESLFEAFVLDAPYKGVFMNFCICGKEYLNKNNFVTHDLFLPKFSKTAVPFELEGTKPSKLNIFSPAEHIIKKDKTEVSNFSGDQGEEQHQDLHTGDNKEFEL
jgi:hypothetical protein